MILRSSYKLQENVTYDNKYCHSAVFMSIGSMMVCALYFAENLAYIVVLLVLPSVFELA